MKNVLFLNTPLTTGSFWNVFIEKHIFIVLLNDVKATEIISKCKLNEKTCDVNNYKNKHLYIETRRFSLFWSAYNLFFTDIKIKS